MARIHAAGSGGAAISLVQLRHDTRRQVVRVFLFERAGRPLSRDRAEVRRLLGAVGLAFSAASALSQGIPMARLGGLVTTEDGTPIPGVAVRLISPALQGTREGTTSPTG